MKIVIFCEESQEVCKAFRAKGHEAYSCDILPCSGGHPEWHIQRDARELLRDKDFMASLDMIICHPPCTHTAVSGARYFEEKRKSGQQQEGIDFFMEFADVDVPKIVIEHPIGIMSTVWRKPDQYIEPHEHGHPERKKTALFLKGVQKLIPSNPVEGREQRIWKMPPSKDRAKLRSKTYPGIAKAMADQWG